MFENCHIFPFLGEYPRVRKRREEVEQKNSIIKVLVSSVQNSSLCCCVRCNFLNGGD